MLPHFNRAPLKELIQSHTLSWLTIPTRITTALCLFTQELFMSQPQLTGNIMHCCMYVIVDLMLYGPWLCYILSSYHRNIRSSSWPFYCNWQCYKHVIEDKHNTLHATLRYLGLKYKCDVIAGTKCGEQSESPRESGI